MRKGCEFCLLFFYLIGGRGNHFIILLCFFFFFFLGDFSASFSRSPWRGGNSYTLMEQTVRFMIKRFCLCFNAVLPEVLTEKQAASKLRRESIKMTSKGCRYGAWSSPRNVRCVSLSPDTPPHPNPEPTSHKGRLSFWNRLGSALVNLNLSIFPVEILEHQMSLVWLCLFPSGGSQLKVWSGKCREAWKWKLLSGVRLFATPRTIQSMESSRPGYWSG